jgi:hypothetical protein
LAYLGILPLVKFQLKVADAVVILEVLTESWLCGYVTISLSRMESS